MPWVEARLHGQRVLARAKADGSWAVEGTHVEVRYRPDSARAYRARASNLVREDGAPMLPDDACIEAKPAPPKAKRSGSRSVAGASSPPAAASSAPTGASSPPAAAGSAPTSASSAPTGASSAPTGASSDANVVGTMTIPQASGVRTSDSGRETIEVYADGACSGNPGPAGLGVVILDGDERIEISEYLGAGTNNIAELTAIERALDALPDTTRPTVIHTDSSYSIGVLSKGWKAKANTELVRRVRARLTERSSTRLVYVPGHAGVALNERTDELAREAVRTGRSRTERIKAGRPGS